jgi:HSP20 family molecular chaperone IbpA
MGWNLNEVQITGTSFSGAMLEVPASYKHESLDKYEIRVLLPGYSANEVIVEFEKEKVSVKTHPVRGWDCPEMEWKKEMFTNFSVPGAESVCAVLKSGVLYITAPKKVKGVSVDVKEEE